MRLPWVPAFAGTTKEKIAAAAIFLILSVAPVFAAGDEKPETLPRFASLRWAEVNLRTGPGDRYPIEWILTKKGMPVEVVDKYDVWRKVLDWQGSSGWVHERTLAGGRTVMVTGQMRSLRAEPSATAPVVAKAEPGALAQLLACRGAWCRIEAQGIKGWLERGQIWGVFPDEVVE